MIQIVVSVLTVSDRSAKGIRQDVSGPLLVEFAKSKNWKVLSYALVEDNKEKISKLLIQWSEKTDPPHIIFTTGGTGFAPRDVTPEATNDVIEKVTPGLSEMMRLKSNEINPHAMLSRAVSGIRKKTLIINLPGGPKAAIENINIILPILPHAIELMINGPNAELNHNFFL